MYGIDGWGTSGCWLVHDNDGWMKKTLEKKKKTGTYQYTIRTVGLKKTVKS